MNYMKFDIKGQPATEAYEEMFKTLLQESDRGVFIVATALLDSFMVELLRYELKKCNSNKTVKEEFIKSLHSYHKRMTACHALGFIPKDVHDELSLIKKIRNSTAHNYSNFSLDDIEDEIMRLSLADVNSNVWDLLNKAEKKSSKNPEEVSVSRLKFIFAMSVTNMLFYLSAPMRGIDLDKYKESIENIKLKVKDRSS
ncbi:hypothetical protein [Maridesulfovibrio ferrireducens]|uniref:hypothetical protein n=1 Tax=Maridesulfovibrio ferrireducens TaxID=246191 RepID=UPI001A18E899|nr:hypothetical protein [Maridesulfovibrio ferrireducens]MBI9110096.1 hypothetical protein [Maridesulfovibrio ferrireducens]